jgi:hypothetical protein
MPVPLPVFQPSVCHSLCQITTVHETAAQTAIHTASIILMAKHTSMHTGLLTTSTAATPSGEAAAARQGLGGLYASCKPSPDGLLMVNFDTLQEQHKLKSGTTDYGAAAVKPRGNATVGLCSIWLRLPTRHVPRHCQLVVRVGVYTVQDS